MNVGKLVWPKTIAFPAATLDGSWMSAIYGLLRSRAASSPLAMAFLVLVWIFQDWATFIHGYKGSLITPWDPGIGILFAIIIHDGALYGIVLFVGVICAEFVTRHGALGLPVIFATAAIIASAYTVVAVIVRRYFVLDVKLERLRDSVTLIVAGMAGAIVVATLLSLLLVISGRFDEKDLFPSMVREFVGDTIGIAVVSPLVLRFWYLRHEFKPERALELVIYAIMIISGLWFVLNTKSHHIDPLFLPIVLAAIRRGFDGACFSLLMTQIGLVILLQHFGFDAETFTEFQIFMLILTTTGLSVGAIVSEREQVQRAFEDTQERLKKKESQAIQAGRFNLVTAMASALAHEINQPITAARALARSVEHLLDADTPDLPRAKRNVSTSIVQMDTAAKTIQRMREFLHRGRPSIGEVAVRDLMDDALTLLRPELAMALVRIEISVEEDLPTLRGDRGQMEQIILNLVRNAIEAIADAGQQDGYVKVAAWHSKTRSNLEISVLDNGPGMDPDIIAHIFEPLTSSKVEGLGLGLSICASIVEAHGGRLWLERSKPDGTEFRLSVPFDGVRVSNAGETDQRAERPAATHNAQRDRHAGKPSNRSTQ
jgi:two-component system, LuxR family, sensor kinase FixL